MLWACGRKRERGADMMILEMLERRRLLTAVLGLTTDNQVVVFDDASPGVILSQKRITGLGKHEKLVGIDFDSADDELFGITDANRIFAIILVSGEAVLDSVGPLVPVDEPLNFDFATG